MTSYDSDENKVFAYGLVHKRCHSIVYTPERYLICTNPWISPSSAPLFRPWAPVAAPVSCLMGAPNPNSPHHYLSSGTSPTDQQHNTVQSYNLWHRPTHFVILSSSPTTQEQKLISLCKRDVALIYNQGSYKSMAQCNIAVSPMLMHWRCHSLAQSH